MLTWKFRIMIMITLKMTYDSDDIDVEADSDGDFIGYADHNAHNDDDAAEEESGDDKNSDRLNSLLHCSQLCRHQSLLNSPWVVQLLPIASSSTKRPRPSSSLASLSSLSSS